MCLVQWYKVVSMGLEPMMVMVSSLISKNFFSGTTPLVIEDKHQGIGIIRDYYDTLFESYHSVCLKFRSCQEVETCGLWAKKKLKFYLPTSQTHTKTGVCFEIFWHLKFSPGAFCSLEKTIITNFGLKTKSD